MAAAGTVPGTDAPRAQGKLSFIDNTVDATTGVIRVKAQFDNRDTALWPGQYVNTRITVQTLKNAVVMPQNGYHHQYARGTYRVRGRCRPERAPGAGRPSAQFWPATRPCPA